MAKFLKNNGGSYGKTIALLLVLTLVFGGVVGGTVAWLVATPDPVINTFTYGDVNITLSETPTGLDDDNNDNTNEYKMIPGEDIYKDPVVTVKAGSEKLYLFVKLEKSEGFDDLMTYEMADGWAALDGVDGVYWQEVDALEATSDPEFHVLKDDKVVVKEEIGKTEFYALSAYPTLTVTAYAVQHAGNATVADAWAKVQ